MTHHRLQGDRPEEARKGLEFVCLERVDDAVAAALEPAKLKAKAEAEPVALRPPPTDNDVLPGTGLVPGIRV